MKKNAGAAWAVALIGGPVAWFLIGGYGLCFFLLALTYAVLVSAF